MQGGRGGRQGLFGFGDPFVGFGSFGQPGNIMSGFFGGANPFDDPFFTNPFGGMMQPSFSTPFSGMMQPSFMNPFGSMMQPSLLGSSMFASHGNLNGGTFGSQTHLNQGMSNASGFIQQASESSRPKGPIIKELSSDDEDKPEDDKEDGKKNGNFRKHPRESREPCVEDPDEEEEEDNKRPKHRQFGRELSRSGTSRLQPQTFMFQSSTITLEESKEADTTTGKATHRISRGIGIKGHSLTRNLNSDGRVNTLQTLHNLNEDELGGFEESWQRNARQNMPGWDTRMNMLGNGNLHTGFRDANQRPALPAPGRSRKANSSWNFQNGSSTGRAPRT
ncbi:glycine-rich protein [Zea mays]|uniref:Glycine-rich protein n=1 Tax=Zea mays TaxID=4577 RepID=A0A1D6LEH4_MAIZE|nr:glycine-rich protein [Zea mays]